MSIELAEASMSGAAAARAGGVGGRRSAVGQDPRGVVDDSPLLICAAGDPVCLIHDRKVERGTVNCVFCVCSILSRES
ncbi:hypothetical protein [Streptomyces decoyicus]|uniref:hypothetical protein n=1 Tax=Streptomyces decoyicus TaxID=249567 RepID=UPI0033B9190C